MNKSNFVKFNACNCIVNFKAYYISVRLLKVSRIPLHVRYELPTRIVYESEAEVLPVYRYVFIVIVMML